MEVIVKNKKSSYEYEFIEQITAGIKLFGSEIKSIRNHKVSISESYVYIKNGEVYIKGMHISEYKQSGIHTNHEPTRLRKLLLNKREILKLDDSIQQKGLTIVPISVIINNKGLVKIEIALCRGKKIHDKRNDLKDKDIKREVDRELNIKF
jgi:SsrA-binding protein